MANERAIKQLFDGLFALTDLRMIFRESTPTHDFSEEQKKRAKEALGRARKAIADLEKELNP